MTSLLALSLLAAFPLSAAATDERVGEVYSTYQEVDVQVDDVGDYRPTDKADSDRPVRDEIRDEPTDRPVRDVRDTNKVRDRCLLTDNPRRCLHDDRPHDFNIRHLIWRLIKAQEWEKLFRLLHWLGLI